MLKTQTILEVKIGERVYTLQLDPQSPLGEAYDAVTQMRGYIIDKIVEENNKSKPKEQAEKAVE